jgi:hypothetical protein
MTTGSTASIGLIQGFNYTIAWNKTDYVPQTTTYIPNTSTNTITFNAYQERTIDITFREETTNDVIDDRNVSFNLISDVFSKSYTTSDGTLLIELLQPATYLSQYNADGYAQRSYSFNVVEDSSDQLDLYLLNSTLASEITFTIIDQTTQEVEGALVKALVKDVDTNTFKLVEIGTTNFEGETILDLQKNQDYHKIIIQKDNQTLKITDQFIITKDTYTFQVAIGGGAIQPVLDIEQFSTALNYDNNTNEFTFSYNDKNSISNEVCLEIEQGTDQGLERIANTCSTSASGSIVETITPVNGTTYIARGYYNDDADIRTDLTQLSITIPDSSPSFENLGLFIQIIIVLAFVGIGYAIDVITVPTLGSISLIVGSYMNLHSISTTVLYSLLFIMTIVTFVAVRTRG